LQARNSEKAQSMLFRFREAQAADLGIIDASRVRRPRNVSSVETVPECERWRGQVLKEISRKMTQIQDVALSDFQIRDINDQLNKLMREKHAWEMHIRNLGGPNYTRGAGGGGGGGRGGGSKIYDAQGQEIPGLGGGGRGYKYYGRARELPGVKEMFEAAKQAKTREADEQRDDADRRADMRRLNLDAHYYGFGPECESDDEQREFEAKREAELRDDMIKSGVGLVPPEGWEPVPEWTLPTLEEVQQELIERRRQRLLEEL
jgi:pre-mRNA-splicing factor ISY1